MFPNHKYNITKPLPSCGIEKNTYQHDQSLLHLHRKKIYEVLELYHQLQRINIVKHISQLKHDLRASITQSVERSLHSLSSN